MSGDSWMARLAKWVVSRDDRYKNELLGCVALFLSTLTFGLVTITSLNNSYTDWAVFGPLLIGGWLLAACVWTISILRWRRKTRAGTLGRGVWATFGFGTATMAIVLAALSAWTFDPARQAHKSPCMDYCPPAAEGGVAPPAPSGAQ